MTVNYRDAFALRNHATPQNEAIPGRESEMKKNAPGTAQVFKVDIWTQVERFLILGSESGSFYVGERELTIENAKAVVEAAKQDGLRLVQLIKDISVAGRAHKNDPALFALAIASAAEDLVVRQAALAALPEVARIGTHLLHFANYVEGFRGWGNALKKAVANWYLTKNPDQLAYQLVKYQQRDGWAQRDLLRLSHPKGTVEQSDVFAWAIGGFDRVKNVNELPNIIAAYETIKSTDDKSLVIDLIHQFNLPREALTTEWLGDADIWDALMRKMPMTALIRNLGTLSKHGLIGSGSEGEQLVINQITNVEHLQKSRIHPIAILAAMKTYGAGQGVRGTNTWSVNNTIVDALDSAFYGTFQNVVPTGKRAMMAIDCSGSMASATVSGIPNLSAREAVAAMALVAARTDPGYEFYGFCNRLTKLNVDPSMKIDQVVKVINRSDWGSTDCSAPMNWAYDNKVAFDAFTIWTDNDTGTGRYYSGNVSMQPSVRLKQYRNQMGIPTKMIVCATQAYDYSIADPQDSGMIDIVGFDANVPNFINDFIRK